MPSGDGGAEDRGLGGHRALQAGRRLGVGGPGHERLEHGSQVGGGHRHVAGDRREVSGRDRSGRSARGPRSATASVVAVVVGGVGSRSPKGMPWRGQRGGLACRRARRTPPCSARDHGTGRHRRTRAGSCDRCDRAPSRFGSVRQPASTARPGRARPALVVGSGCERTATVVVPGGQLDDEAVLAVGAGLHPHPPAVQAHVLGDERQARGPCRRSRPAAPRPGPGRSARRCGRARRGATPGPRSATTKRTPLRCRARRPAG